VFSDTSHRRRPARASSTLHRIRSFQRHVWQVPVTTVSLTCDQTLGLFPLDTSRLIVRADDSRGGTVFHGVCLSVCCAADKTHYFRCCIRKPRWVFLAVMSRCIPGFPFMASPCPLAAGFSQVWVLHSCQCQLLLVYRTDVAQLHDYSELQLELRGAVLFKLITNCYTVVPVAAQGRQDRQVILGHE